MGRRSSVTAASYVRMKEAGTGSGTEVGRRKSVNKRGDDRESVGMAQEALKKQGR